MTNRFVVLFLAIAVLPMTAIPSRGIDPDIQRALNEAPPPGDYERPIVHSAPDRLATLNAAMEHHLILLKLARCRVATIGFKDTPALTAFHWLVEQSEAFDSNHEGINLAFDIRVLTGWDNYKPLDHTVTLSLSEPHLDEALKQITELLKLRYEVEGTVVYIHAAK